MHDKTIQDKKITAIARVDWGIRGRTLKDRSTRNWKMKWRTLTVNGGKLCIVLKYAVCFLLSIRTQNCGFSLYTVTTVTLCLNFTSSKAVRIKPIKLHMQYAKQMYTEVIGFIVLFACVSSRGSGTEAAGSRGRRAVSVGRMDGNIMLRRATECDEIEARTAAHCRPAAVASATSVSIRPTRATSPFPSASGRHSTRNERQQEIGKYENAPRTHAVIRSACRLDELVLRGQKVIVKPLPFYCPPEWFDGSNVCLVAKHEHQPDTVCLPSSNGTPVIAPCTLQSQTNLYWWQIILRPLYVV